MQAPHEKGGRWARIDEIHHKLIFQMIRIPPFYQLSTQDTSASFFCFETCHILKHMYVSIISYIVNETTKFKMKSK